MIRIDPRRNVPDRRVEVQGEQVDFVAEGERVWALLPGNRLRELDAAPAGSSPTCRSAAPSLRASAQVARDTDAGRTGSHVAHRAHDRPRPLARLDR